MHTEVRGGDGCVEIRLHGRFMFDAHAAFAAAGDKAIARNTREIRINLSRVEYMDSAGLGMLLILRERASAAGKSLSLTECPASVQGVMKLANFHRLFSITPLGASAAAAG